MAEPTLIKPRVIQEFERRFKIEADHWGDVSYVRLTSSWEDLFRTAFCFISDSGLKEEKAFQFKSGIISPGGVTFNGSLLFFNIWGSDCMLGQGTLKTPIRLGRLSMNLSGGIYLLAWASSDILSVWD